MNSAVDGGGLTTQKLRCYSQRIFCIQLVLLRNETVLCCSGLIKIKTEIQYMISCTHTFHKHVFHVIH
jgi:hypothetical protein